MKTFIFAKVITFLIVIAGSVQSGGIPADRVLESSELVAFLKQDVSGLEKVYELRDKGDTRTALNELAAFFRQKAAERYYFDWRYFEERFEAYSKNYPSAREDHARLAEFHMTRYSPETHWQLPFKNNLGEEVTAYQLRHVARQQKSADMAMMYFYEDKDPTYPDYFTRQVADLNRAFEAGAYDDEGNGVYEVFRAGKRIHNWLFCYNAYLNSPQFDMDDQLLLIRTFLHHGAQLQKRSERYRDGNHHTRGLVALFEIASFLREFHDSDKWLDQAIDGLTKHITREINSDGFQFERTVHYHKGDIENYFRVFQLARRGGIELPQKFLKQFRKMFDALVALGQPNRRLPVLQDDTDSLFAENNDISDVMSIAVLLYQDPVYQWFAGEGIPANIFWLFRQEELERPRPQAQKPTILSTELAETGYYIMRNGWEPRDEVMVISAGLSDRKPDHQHGDMLGIVAYAEGTEILPNYQVKYNQPDYRYWKNSLVKNVALADSVLQGGGWRGNRGGSGFGKWRFLPEPQVRQWIKSSGFDYFAGSHNGFDSLGVVYEREVLFVKDGFWIIADSFRAKEIHSYSQIWQGPYDVFDGKAFRDLKDGTLTISPASPKDILAKTSAYRGKGRVAFTVSSDTTSIITLIDPGAAARIWTEKAGETFSGYSHNADLALFSKDGRQAIFAGCSRLSGAEKNVKNDRKAFILVSFENGTTLITVLDHVDGETVMKHDGN